VNKITVPSVSREQIFRLKMHQNCWHLGAFRPLGEAHYSPIPIHLTDFRRRGMEGIRGGWEDKGIEGKWLERK
jgi:hypothetical protein